MSLTFGSHFTLSYEGAAMPAQIEKAQQVTKVFGGLGHTVLDGARQSRPIQIPFWEFGGYGTEAALLDFLLGVEQKAGQVDTLTASSVGWGVCEFLGMTQDKRHYDSAKASWLAQGVLYFNQLRP